MFSISILGLAGFLGLMLCGSAGAQAAPDSVWRKHLAFLSDRGGVWLTSNASYRTEQNQEPHQYGMRYWMGFGGTAQHGCLWGVSPGRSPAVFWHYFTGWDPVRKALLVQQSGASGVIGLGWESAETGIAEQTFTAPDGTSWEIRHQSLTAGPDTLVTQSFRRRNENWEPQRTYTWIREPAGATSPC